MKNNVGLKFVKFILISTLMVIFYISAYTLTYNLGAKHWYTGYKKEWKQEKTK